MLHSPIYNQVLSPELKEAYRNRDHDALWGIIKDNAIALVELDPSEEKHALTCARLQVALALHDSLVTGGEACSFIMDYVNL